MNTRANRLRDNDTGGTSHAAAGPTNPLTISSPPNDDDPAA